LNATAASEYHGKLILRFDDTNPSKESLEFQESQLADLHTLGVTPDQVSFTSDYFDVIEERGLQMIRQGDAYCDDTPQQQVRYPNSNYLTPDERRTHARNKKQKP
jgi:glutamyl-tRNA synthetase